MGMVLLTFRIWCGLRVRLGFESIDDLAIVIYRDWRASSTGTGERQLQGRGIDAQAIVVYGLRMGEIAGETRSHARVACEGPRATVKRRGIAGDRPRATIRNKEPSPFTVGRGPVPRHASVVSKSVRGFLGCGHFSFWRRDRGGQAPALR